MSLSKVNNCIIRHYEKLGPFPSRYIIRDIIARVNNGATVPPKMLHTSPLLPATPLLPTQLQTHSRCGGRRDGIDKRRVTLSHHPEERRLSQLSRPPSYHPNLTTFLPSYPPFLVIQLKPFIRASHFIPHHHIPSFLPPSLLQFPSP